MSRPFSTLGVKPFLRVDAPALAALQTEFYKRSRLYHPDRFVNASDEERAQAEAKSAELNADYARLRDPLKLVESALNEGETPAPEVRKSSGAPPPELAEEYFELQESWMEAGPGSPAARDAAEKFLKRVEAFALSSREELERLTAKFPYQGPGESAPSWTQEDLAMLRKAVHKIRYSMSFERDIRTKFLGA